MGVAGLFNNPILGNLHISKLNLPLSVHEALHCGKPDEQAQIHR